MALPAGEPQKQSRVAGTRIPAAATLDTWTLFSVCLVASGVWPARPSSETGHCAWVEPHVRQAGLPAALMQEPRQSATLADEAWGPGAPASSLQRPRPGDGSTAGLRDRQQPCCEEAQAEHATRSGGPPPLPLRLRDACHSGQALST